MMRPDEQAHASEIERDQSNRQMFRKGIGTVVGAATGAASARIMPLLNEYVPVDLAMKGLSKVAPRVADFLKKGQSAGLDIKDGMEFVKHKLTPTQDPQQEKKNLIEQYSPELHQFISQHIKSGKNHLQAGALARLEKKGEKGFKSIIDKITKEHNASWEDILDAVYGGNQGQSQQTQTPAAQQQAQQQSGQSDAQAQFAKELKALLNS